MDTDAQPGLERSVAEPTASRRGRVRDYRLDRAKGVLIFLVVLGHMCEAVSPRWEADSVRLLLTVIYAFHMPAFVFLAGITASTTKAVPRALTMAVYLVVFQVLYFAFRILIGQPFEWSWITPHWILWFLLAMIVWQLTLPVMAKAPRVALAVTVVVGSLAGVASVIDYEFSASRILVFWPFFMAGHVFGRKLLDRIDETDRRVGMAAAVLCLIPLGALFAAGIAPEWFYGSRGFDFLDVGDVRGVLIRLCLYLIAAVMTCALLVMLPQRRGFVARLGERSLSVYLLHGFVVLGFGLIAGNLLDSWHFAFVLLLCVAAAAVVTVVLGAAPLDRGLRRGAALVVDGVWSRPVARRRNPRL